MSWSPTETGTGGAGKISAEAVYHPPEIDYGSAGAGDVNLDGTLNVLDVIVESEREGQGYRIKIIFSVKNEKGPVTFTTFLEATRGT